MSKTKVSLNATGRTVSVEMCADILASLGMQGIDTNNLRWKVGPAQLRAIQSCLYVTSDSSTLRYEAEHGFHNSGIFLGLPYVVDNSIPDDTLLLEELSAVELTRIVELAIPSGMLP